MFTWFKESHMKPNSDKCHLLVTTEKSVSITINGSNVTKKEQKLLGINLINLYPSKVTLQISVKKASQNLYALARIVNYMDLPNSVIVH